MKPLYFIFALHNHQPVGNFDFVFKEAYERSYEPFLDIFERTNGIKICLHTSGPLLDWLEANQPKYLDRLARLVKAGRIEILSGGYYEPLLSLIREDDAIGQFQKMNGYVEKRFRQKPKGFWLTERVWEPSFPSIAAKVGLKYTALDDTHFHYGGLSAEETREYFVTENQGDGLFIFPIDRTLRYSVPFKPVHDTYSYFESLHKKGVRLVTLADDGEKFGLWPGTHKAVYEDKWLEYFFKMLEGASAWLKTATFSEALELLPSRGRIYLPTASYDEMMEWSLPSAQILNYQEFQKELKQKDLYESGKNFVRGGFFRNFFSKYPESSRMQEKQFYVSQKVEKLSNPKELLSAQDELYQGECNCPYWHGVFGGLYLHHLRRSTYHHLINAEIIADQRRAAGYQAKQIVLDYNNDGNAEWIWETRDQSLMVAPHLGGAILEWDDIKERTNVLDTLTRRFEPYHSEIQKRGVTSGGTKGSIHDIQREITLEVFESLVFDQHERYSWIDRLFTEGDLKAFKSERLTSPVLLEKLTYEAEKKGRTWLFTTEFGWNGLKFRLEKSLQPDKRDLKLRTSIELLEGKPTDLFLGSEWNLNLKANDADEASLKSWTLQDEWSPLHFKVSSDREFRLWQFTILTASQSETNYNLNPQGTCVMPFWKLSFQRSKRLSWRWQVGIGSK